MELDYVNIVLLAVALAFLAESMVEYIFGAVADHIQVVEPYRWLLMYIALGVGVLMAHWYQVDLLTLITGDPPTGLGIVLSGLGIGRGANFIHDFVSNYMPKSGDRVKIDDIKIVGPVG